MKQHDDRKLIFSRIGEKFLEWSDADPPVEVSGYTVIRKSC